MELIPLAFAQAGPTLTDLEQINLTDIFYVFVALAIFAAGGLSIAFIFYGGFSFILSGGDEGKVKEAIHTIRYAIIGLVITLLSLFVIPRIIGPIFHVNFSFLDFTTLSNRMNTLYIQFQGNSPETSQTTSVRTRRNPPSARSSTTSPRRQAPNVSIDELIKPQI